MAPAGRAHPRRRRAEGGGPGYRAGGSARISAPNAAPVAIEAGERWTRPGAPDAPDAPEDGQAQPASLAGALVEIGHLRDEIERLSVSGAVARGQLAQSGAAEVVAIDCEEFPCVAAIRPKAVVEDWEKPIQAAVGGMAKAHFEVPVAAMNSANVVDRGAGPEALLGVTRYPPDPARGAGHPPAVSDGWADPGERRWGGALRGRLDCPAGVGARSGGGGGVRVPTACAGSAQHRVPRIDDHGSSTLEVGDVPSRELQLVTDGGGCEQGVDRRSHPACTTGSCADRAPP